MAAEEAENRALAQIPARLGFSDVPRNPQTVMSRLLRLPLVESLATLPIKKALEQMPNHSKWLGIRKRLSPPRQLEAFYSALVSEAKIGEQINLQELNLLIHIGLAGREIEKMSRCSLCPRFAIFRTAFCWQHSQTKNAPGSIKDQASRYRTGKAIARDYHYFFPKNPAFVDLNDRTSPQYIARLLWGKALPDEERTVRAIKQQIALSQPLIDLIGKDYDELGQAKFYNRLQERVDPDEVRPKVWRWKLKRLRHWYAYAEQLIQNKKNAMPAYWAKLVGAAKLEKQGLKKKEIADRLMVSPATISSWMKRSGTSSLQEAYEYHYAHMPRRHRLSPKGLHN